MYSKKSKLEYWGDETEFAGAVKCTAKCSCKGYGSFSGKCSLCYRQLSPEEKVQATLHAECIELVRIEREEEKARVKAEERESKKRARLEAKAAAKLHVKAEPGSDTKKPRIDVNGEANESLRAFSCYWAPHEVSLFRDCLDAPTGIHLTGGNSKRMSHNKLQVGDLYFPVCVKDGKMKVLGCLQVTAVNPSDSLSPEAIDQWHLRNGLTKITNCYFPRILIDTEKKGVNWSLEGYDVGAPDDLRWIKPDGSERAFKNTTPNYMQQALNGVYRLSSSSADALLCVCQPDGGSNS